MSGFILPSAVREFLTAPRDDHRWMKQLTHEQLDAAIAELKPRPDLSHLDLHQKVCFLLGVAYPAFAFWLDMGCVDGETEYLAPDGWRPIREYMGGKVAQYVPQTREAEFVSPLRYIDQPCDEMYHFKSARGCDQMLTLEHRSLVVSSGSPLSKKSNGRADWKHTPVCAYDEERWFFNVSTKDILDNGQATFKCETVFRLGGPGIALTDAQLRVQIAVHADGYLCNKTKVCVSLKKRRKQKRLKQLLAAAGIEFRERKAGNGYHSYTFVPPRHTKTYVGDWFRCSLRQKQIICDEVGHWDGTFGPSGSVSFYSRSKLCAEFIQFCFVSTGRRASLNIGERSTPSRDGRGKFDYVVHVVGTGRTTNLVHLRNGKAVSSSRKYCFEVPSGYLVLRRNGNVFITGNTGKTLLSLELLLYWWNVGLVRKAMVVVKSEKAFLTWMDQMREWGIEFPYVLIGNSPTAKKWAALENFTEGLIIIPYTGLLRMGTKLKKNKRGQNKLRVNASHIEKLAWGLDAIVLDESTSCGNADSLYTRTCKALRRHVEVCYLLAGRPFGRDPTLLWSQYYIVDGGATFGETLGLFRAAFFKEEENPRSRNVYSRTYTFDRTMEPELMRIAQHRSISYGEAECIDVPEFVPIIDEVTLPEEAHAYYDKVVDQIIAAKGNLQAMENAFIRMRQLSSGFLGFRADSGQRVEVAFDENPKLDRQLELLDGLPRERKAVVFYEFTYSGRRIFESLKGLDRHGIWLWSGTKDSAAELRRFMSDPDCSVAVLNWRVGAYSLDGLQRVANYTFFYESPVSVIDREQAERRLRRKGQTRKVFQYDLVTRGTMDRRILQFHEEGDDLLAALRARPEDLLDRTGAAKKVLSKGNPGSRHHGGSLG